MELQELIERIDRWKTRQQGSAPVAAARSGEVPPSFPMEAQDVGEEELSADAGAIEDLEAVEEVTEASVVEEAGPGEETSEVGIDQIEDFEETEDQ